MLENNGIYRTNYFLRKAGLLKVKNLAERQGFEPWEGCPSTVFKTAAFDRSAISPGENTILTTLVLQTFF